MFPCLCDGDNLYLYSFGITFLRKGVVVAKNIDDAKRYIKEAYSENIINFLTVVPAETVDGRGSVVEVIDL